MERKIQQFYIQTGEKVWYCWKKILCIYVIQFKYVNMNFIYIHWYFQLEFYVNQIAI